MADHITDTIHAQLAKLDPPQVDLAVDLVSNGLDGDRSVRTGPWSKRHARRLLEVAELPPPRDWVALGRCLRTLRHLRESSDSVYRSALLTGWPEPASFFRRCRSLFASTPRVVSSRTDSELLTRFLETRCIGPVGRSRHTTTIRRTDGTTGQTRLGSADVRRLRGESAGVAGIRSMRTR